jgi:hypothetical protein
MSTHTKATAATTTSIQVIAGLYDHTLTQALQGQRSRTLTLRPTPVASILTGF